jgi:Flp pilus assembly protein TadG
VISRWLVKIVLGLALLGFLVVELGSPLLTRATLDGQAHQAADDAAHEMFQSRDPDKARAVAEQDAEDDHAKLENFDIDEQGTVRVTLSKQAKSYVLHNFQPTRDWYNVRVSASAVPK